MKKTLITVFYLISILTTFQTQAQQLQPVYDWAATFGGGDRDVLSSCEVDAQGNVVSIGSFKYTVDFNPSPNHSFNLNANDEAGFVQKLDSNGNFIWGAQLGGDTNFVELNDLDIDQQGNYYISGKYRGTVDFDLSGATHFISNTYIQLFVLKVNANGEFMWLYETKTTYGTATPQSLVVNSAGEVYVAGDFGFTTIFESGAGGTQLTADNYTGFCMMLNSDGSFSWAKKFGPLNPDGIRRFYIYALKLDAQENLILGGKFSFLSDFDMGNSMVIKAPQNGLNFNGYILKVAPDGSFIWVGTLESDEPVNVFDVLIRQNGDITITGGFNVEIDLDPSTNLHLESSQGSDDAFVLTLTSTGDYKNSFVFGGASTDYGYSLVEDNQENLYVLGRFLGKVDFDPGINILEIESPLRALFVQKYNSQNQMIWTRTLRVRPETFYKQAYLSLLPSNSLLIAGSLIGSADFDISSGYDMKHSNGDKDFFITKWSQYDPVGLNNKLVERAEVLLYPNPASDVLHINKGSNVSLEITVTNSAGAIVYNSSTEDQLTTINMAKMASGVYVVTLRNELGVSVERIVKR